MLATYSVRGMNFHAFHGSMEVERELGQVFSIDITITHEVSPEDISPSTPSEIHGGNIYDWTKSLVQGTKYQAHTGLAMALAKTILDRIPTAVMVDVAIARKHLFIAGDVDTIVVEVSCDREDFAEV